MTALYLDTSALLAILFGERRGAWVQKQVGRAERVMSSNLLEAEVRAACARERVELEDDVLNGIQWILPDRRLTAELKQVFATGYQRGADAWHLACALFLPLNPAELLFLSVDEKQRSAAAQLGFRLEG